MKVFGYYIVKAEEYEKALGDLTRIRYLHLRGLERQEALQNECNQLMGDLAWKKVNEALSIELGYLRQQILELYTAMHDMETPVTTIFSKVDSLAHDAGVRE